MKLYKYILITGLTVLGLNTYLSQAQDTKEMPRWTIEKGGRGILWDASEGLPHEDHIEMSGESVSCVLRWGVDESRRFHSEKSLVFPMLRTVPNNTHASLMFRVATDIPSLLSVNGRTLVGERVDSVRINGMVEETSLWSTSGPSIGVDPQGKKGKDLIQMTRTVFPSTTLPAVYERFTIKNVGKKSLLLTIPEYSQISATEESAGVDGTYRYYKGNTLLRSWICMPLIAGIENRAEGTVAALSGPELMSKNGCLTEQGSSTFWDRSTLYALRGIFYSGETDKALALLEDYSSRRLRGEHVPYAVEAWPEGSQRHLSAESGLYCRVITEGLFGLRPTGLHSFSMRPALPQGWSSMSLRHIHAFGSDFDITVSRITKGELEVILTEHVRSQTGTSIEKKRKFRSSGNFLNITLK